MKGLWHESEQNVMLMAFLKVLTNEKRGGLTEVSFDRSGYKLFWL